MSDDLPMLYLSPPHVGDDEIAAVTAAIRSGWVAPLGPEVDGFERDIAQFSGTTHAVALSSGTAALHLALLAVGVGAGDRVIVPTMTFGATAFAVTYTGATPVFLDVEEESWNLDPQLLDLTLADMAHRGELPAAIVSVDVFGRPCQYERILQSAAQYEVPVIADAAEALGAFYRGTPVGSFGRAAVFSFNGNKIMTTSGGGMLVTDDAALATKVRYWSTQSREPLPWYEHEEIGFNYRMSNVLAALGRAQLRRLPAMIERRREIFSSYREQLADCEGVTFIGDPDWGRSTMWLTTMLCDPVAHPHAPTLVREALMQQRIESRPVWKPMHQQPVFAMTEQHLTGVADAVFAQGLCLPSGSAMTDDEVHRVCTVIRDVLAR